MVKVGYDTNVGMKRKKNEDAYHMTADGQVFMVADGVGGNNSGEVASKTGVEFIGEHLLRNPLPLFMEEKEIKAYFIHAIGKANEAILAKAKAKYVNQGMATTLVLVCIYGGKAFVFNVGDSRAYIIRQGKLKQVTEDHSFVNTLVRIGTITKEEGRVHPKKNIITRALGAEEEMEIDFFAVDLEPGDVILLCTDGLHGEVGDTVIEEMAGKAKDMQNLCDELVSRANLLGGNDNITVICLKYEGEI